MKKIVFILFFIVIIFVIQKQFIVSSCDSYKLSKKEEESLWKRVKSGDNNAINKLIIYYRLHDFDNNLVKIKTLRKKQLDKSDFLSCYIYGKFLTQHFPKDSQEFQDGVYWLKHSQKLGSKDAEFLLNRIER